MSGCQLSTLWYRRLSYRRNVGLTDTLGRKAPPLIDKHSSFYPSSAALQYKIGCHSAAPSHQHSVPAYRAALLTIWHIAGIRINTLAHHVRLLHPPDQKTCTCQHLHVSQGDPFVLLRYNYSPPLPSLLLLVIQNRPYLTAR